MYNKKLKTFWEKNKDKILLGAGAAVLFTSGITMAVTLKKHGDVTVNIPLLNSEPSRKIPDMDGFSISDIADDVNDGCIAWLEGCKLSDCGKFGKELCKIERVDPEMLITMAILSHDEK